MVSNIFWSDSLAKCVFYSSLTKSADKSVGRPCCIDASQQKALFCNENTSA